MLKQGLAACGILISMSCGQGEAADIDGGYTKPPVAGTQLRGSFGMRTWFSSVKADYDHADIHVFNAEDINSISTEAYYRLESSATRFYFQGTAGIGANLGGRFKGPYVVDRDLGNSAFGYFNADLGFRAFDLKGHTLGAFVGYQYVHDKFKTPSVNRYYYYRNPSWLLGRLGVSGHGQFTDKFGWHAEAAYIPVGKIDTGQNVETSKDAKGYQAEVFLTYSPTEAWSLGLGARHWRFEGELERSGQKFTVDYTRSGLLLEAAYKF